jgi:hypothetical protein
MSTWELELMVKPSASVPLQVVTCPAMVGSGVHWAAAGLAMAMAIAARLVPATSEKLRARARPEIEPTMKTPLNQGNGTFCVSLR